MSYDFSFTSLDTPFSMSVALRVFLHTPCNMCVVCKSYNVLSTYQRRLAQKSKIGIMKCTRRNFIVAVTHTQIPKINFSPSLLDPDKIKFQSYSRDLLELSCVIGIIYPSALKNFQSYTRTHARVRKHTQPW